MKSMPFVADLLSLGKKGGGGKSIVKKKKHIGES